MDFLQLLYSQIGLFCTIALKNTGKYIKIENLIKMDQKRTKTK